MNYNLILRWNLNEFSKIVSEEVEKLPVVYGSTFTLFAIQEMSYEEIVQVTGLPLGTVKARLFRARAMLTRSNRKANGSFSCNK